MPIKKNDNVMLSEGHFSWGYTVPRHLPFDTIAIVVKVHPDPHKPSVEVVWEDPDGSHEFHHYEEADLVQVAPSELPDLGMNQGNLIKMRQEAAKSNNGNGNSGNGNQENSGGNGNGGGS